MELEEIYKEIQPSIYAFFYVKTLNNEIAEDLTQEVFYQALKGFSEFSGNSTVKTWVFSIAKNVLLKHLRSKKYRGELSTLLQNEVHIQQQKSIEEEVIQQEEKQRLFHLIASLDEVTKEILTLRIYGDLSFKEIGMLVKKSENYARITFHRAKLKLQKELKESER